MDMGQKTSGKGLSPIAGRSEGVVSAPIIHHYMRICEAQGIPREDMLAAAGVSEWELNPQDTWVSQLTIERLFHGRLKRWPDPLLGLHFAAAMEPSRAGVLGFMSLSCPTILDLHNTLRDFGRLVSNILSTTLQHEPGRVLWTIDFSYADEAVTRHSTEWVLAAFGTLVSRLDARALLAVHMRHAPLLVEGELHPDYTCAFACPIHFGQAHSALVLDPQYLNKVSPNGDPLVFAALQQQAARLLEQLGPVQRLCDRVRQEIRVLLAEGRVSRDEVCRRIGISSRHLHRQLQEQGVSYQGLLDELRMEQARARVGAPDFDMERTSEALGFASAKSFARWFVTQTGATPAAYRRQLHDCA